MKTIYFLISESLIGSHCSNELEEEVFFFDMSIPVNVKFDQTEGRFINNTTLEENKHFKNIIKKYNENKDKAQIFFLVGFDVDIQGEYMANVLRDELLKQEIDINTIFRTPLMDGEYLAIQEFKSIDSYLNYKGLELKFAMFLRQYNSKNKKNIPIMSFRKLLSLKKLSQEKGKNFAVKNNQGTSTFTYITNRLNKDYTSSKEKKKWLTKAV